MVEFILVTFSVAGSSKIDKKFKDQSKKVRICTLCKPITAQLVVHVFCVMLGLGPIRDHIHYYQNANPHHFLITVTLNFRCCSGQSSRLISLYSTLETLLLL